MTPAPQPAAKPKRRWYQFSLRTLLVVAPLLAVFLGVVVRRAEQQRRAVRAIQMLDGRVLYSPPDSLTPEAFPKRV